MADNSTNRAYRSNDTLGRTPYSGAPANDPLAELARLIGQEDPFAEFGQPERGSPQHRAGRVPPPEWPGQPPHSGQGAAPYYDAAGQPYPVAAHEASHHQGGEAADRDYDAPQGEADYAAHGYYADELPAEKTYDDAPPRRQRVAVIAIVALFVLAVVGTAGAYGYRTLFARNGSAVPPIIKADTAPAKVAPPAKSEAQANKLIYDRVGEQTSNEKIVSREEQPVDLKDKVPNAAVSDARTPAVDAGNVATAAPTFASVDQPKKVHTIVIRPDQPQGLASAATVSAPMPAPQTTAAVPSPPSPPPAPKPAPPQPQRVASAPPTATAPHERAAPAHQSTAASHNAPLSLSPNAEQPVRRPEPTRTASAPAAAAHPAPASAHAGGYAVQVSAQRSEAEAQAAFRSLQGKYPSQLGGRQPIIKRADLGSKGVYYRAMVGPFASSGEASQLCQSLKAAGGSCLIQRD